MAESADVDAVPRSEALTAFGGLDTEEWDRLAGDHFYSTSDWLRFCTAETGTPGDAVVVDDDAGRCAVPVRELSGLPAWSTYRWNDHLSEAGLPHLRSEGLLVGSSEGFQTHVLRSGDHSPDRLTRLVGRLREAGGTRAERSCVAMYLTTRDVRELREAGVTAAPVLLDADAWIPVPEDGWDAWLETFPRKRRRNIRNEEKTFRESGLRISHLALADCWHTLGTPAASTLAKYGHSTTPETEMVSMRRAVDVLGDKARVAVCHRPGDAEHPVGFCIYYESADKILIRWVGFDNDRLSGLEEYFNVLFYTQVRRAPDRRTRWIHAGATTQAAKALRGAELRPLWMLDLTADSPLALATDDVHAHNRRFLQRFLDDPRTAGALSPREDWELYC
ncbi:MULTISPECIES: peptidogalycan biosysnthesis protein [unclassified Streptomyces]|uniref:peptidogalycan biosysnthesis protein n=1 Tax=unclassified Streptomyces TaxID=2593676 RepID=UPI002E2A8384|nr:peptidogalycan biosysnthesis protein [Streptomyces sp. NBC_01423]WSX95736.1 peptidogalycan biosysnthesis protein [Streptomyces sp. NBC_00891]WSY10216.1 peptidogalycan biosysnthesis protein [Streptomyces sp. NBC_00890]WSZ11650.1 peptidogalycan biosysnthesis protein [Streptomyces sp. NBC_00869]WSZ27944.1 peptidogalycan biosysnthesis protein [Streptomyces sp. NBC_00870]